MIPLAGQAGIIAEVDVPEKVNETLKKVHSLAKRKRGGLGL
jgi:hypothetical protein